MSKLVDSLGGGTRRKGAIALFIIALLLACLAGARVISQAADERRIGDRLRLMGAEVSFGSGSSTWLQKMEDWIPQRAAVKLWNPESIDDQVALAAQFGNLEKLSVSDLPISRVAFLALRRSRDLRVLEVDGTRFGDEWVAVIASNRSLEQLDLSGTLITDVGVAQLRAFGDVKEIDLSDTAVTDEACESLAHLHTLREIGFGNTEVTGNKFGRLRELRDLQRLDLAHTQITDQTVFGLGIVSALRVLDVTETQLTDAAVEPLSRLKELRELCISRTQMTPRGIEQLKAALPNCRIRVGDKLRVRIRMGQGGYWVSN